MTAKQLAGILAPDAATYVTLTDGAGNLVTLSGTGGTVSTVSFVNANGISGVVATASTTPAITLNLAGSTSWTPVDKSADALTFTSVNAQYTQIGNMVTAYGTLTYPSTSSANAAVISLPVAVPNQTYASVISKMKDQNLYIRTIPSSTTAALVSNANIPVANSTQSLSTVAFIITYPAT